MRHSKQREALLKLLRSTKSHPDAGWLYDNLRKEFPHISLGTVYRNLSMLAQNGDILEISCGNTTHYDATTALHYHAYCRVCRKIFDIPKEKLSLTLCLDTLFELENCEMLLHGICRSCSKKEK